MRSPTVTTSSQVKSRASGFTLIELLMVIAVIMILSAITFGISRGVQDAQSRAKVKVELATIAQALEQYKAKEGDYPWVEDDPEELVQALLGWMEFENNTFVAKSTEDVPDSGPKAYIDITKLGSAGELPENPKTMPTTLQLTDPWGESYKYYYKTSPTSSWDNFGYVLYSAGPDGTHSPVGADGILTNDIKTSEDNIDNIYSGE